MWKGRAQCWTLQELAPSSAALYGFFAHWFSSRQISQIKSKSWVLATSPVPNGREQEQTGVLGENVDNVAAKETYFCHS